MSLDLLLVDSLHDFAKQYYSLDKSQRRQLDMDACTLVSGKSCLLYADIYDAFKAHYHKKFYEKQKGLTFE